MSKHTPGPWSVAKTKHFKMRINGPRGHLLVQRQVNLGPDFHERCEENAANARLIAAAPGLLEKAKALRDFLLPQIEGEGGELDDLCGSLGEEIAKAEGK